MGRWSGGERSWQSDGSGTLALSTATRQSVDKCADTTKEVVWTQCGGVQRDLTVQHGNGESRGDRADCNSGVAGQRTAWQVRDRAEVTQHDMFHTSALTLCQLREQLVYIEVA